MPIYLANKTTARTEHVEVRRSWFDMLTTNGFVTALCLSYVGAVPKGQAAPIEKERV